MMQMDGKSLNMAGENNKHNLILNLSNDVGNLQQQ